MHFNSLAGRDDFNSPVKPERCQLRAKHIRFANNSQYQFRRIAGKKPADGLDNHAWRMISAMPIHQNAGGLTCTIEWLGHYSSSFAITSRPL